MLMILGLYPIETVYSAMDGVFKEKQKSKEMYFFFSVQKFKKF